MDPETPSTSPPPPSDLAACLAPSFYMDFHTPALSTFAADVGGGGEPRERAVRLFEAVRDGIVYDPYNIQPAPEFFRASYTLAQGRGYCVTKAILLAAAARATGIPSRVGFADVVNHLASKRLLAIMRTDVFAFHGFVELYLDGRWVKATPTFDRGLCDKVGLEPLAFDGRHDALFLPYDRAGRRSMEYVRQRGVFTDFPLPAMIEAWREIYPHFFEAGLAQPAPGGDFHREVEAPDASD